VGSYSPRMAIVGFPDGTRVRGSGRTGTVLACMAVLAGVPPPEAVEWVRANYRPEAVETVEQEAWVRWFAEWLEPIQAPLA
jgi:protein-tyrosine phosphatase